MTITERHLDGAVVFDITGPISGRGLWSILPNVHRHLESGRRLIVMNLAAVPSVNVDGLAALDQAAGAAREAGCIIRLAGITARLTDLVVLTRLLTAFETFDSVEEALSPCLVLKRHDTTAAVAQEGLLTAAVGGRA